MISSKTKNHIAAGHDVIMAGVAFLLALYLRLGDATWYLGWGYIAYATALFMVICGTVFSLMRLYRGMWRYASMQDLLTIGKATSLAVLLYLPTLFLFTRLEGMPRSVLVIVWLLLLILLGGPRFLYRLVKDGRVGWDMRALPAMRIPALLVGTEDEAALYLRETQKREDAGEYTVVGLLDQGGSQTGRTLLGVRVLGTVASLKSIVEKLERRDGTRVRKIIVADRDLKGAPLRQLVETAEGLGLSVARLPSLQDLQHAGGVKLEARPIAIEDLLGRAQNALDKEAMRALVTGRRVLVTGAGGTIGSELVRQIAAVGPESLTLLELSEHNLYLIDHEIAANFPSLSRTSVLADVRDKEHLTRIFTHQRPELVFHAAAVKHVPLSEANPDAAVTTNIFGTRNVAECAATAGCEAMVLISTDKAVNPLNVMGATKRVAEMVCQSTAMESKTRFITVRFGNVLGSSGSVVPLFQKQLAAGGPITITHPDMVRYFMTVREAVELVLTAAAAGCREFSQAEHREGLIFVLDMGEPVRIRDLAEQMIRLAGFKPGEDIQIVTTGLRPGEKLFEELFYFNEAPVKTKHERIMLAKPRAVEAKALRDKLQSLKAIAEHREASGLRTALKEIAPEYKEA